MSEPSSLKLARALEDVGSTWLAARARKDEFHDYRSPHDLPQHALVACLKAEGDRTQPLIDRVIAGEFDATKAESDAYIASEEGQADLAELLGPGPGKESDDFER